MKIQNNLDHNFSTCPPENTLALVAANGKKVFSNCPPKILSLVSGNLMHNCSVNTSIEYIALFVMYMCVVLIIRVSGLHHFKFAKFGD